MDRYIPSEIALKAVDRLNTTDLSPSQSVAANLPPDTRQKLAIEMLAKSKPVGYLAAEHQVSRKFLYGQSQKAKTALEELLSLACLAMIL